MSDDRMKIPGSDHPITLVREMSRAVIRAAGRQIGETGDVLTLHESAYAPVHYVPRGDLDMNLFTRATPSSFSGSADRVRLHLFRRSSAVSDGSKAEGANPVSTLQGLELSQALTRQCLLPG